MYLKNTDVEKRYSIFPIKNQSLWDFYKKMETLVWQAEEIDLSKDRFDELNKDEQTYLKNILAFFTISDGFVIDNIVSNFVSEVDILEAQYGYGVQNFIEQVHANGYSLLIDTYIKDPIEKKELFDSMETNEAVNKKASWAENWINKGNFPERLVAFALVEGLSFSSVFAGVFWYRSRNLMEGLGEMNEFIVRDETSHYEFAVNLYNNYLKDEYKLDKKVLLDMVLSCVEVEKTFVEESMPSGLKGLTQGMMIDYVKYVADIILNDFGCDTYFNSKNPLDYMSRIGLSNKNNFFERRTGEYSKVEIPTDEEGLFDSEDF